MNTVEILTKARSFIEAGWCQGATARTDKDRPIGYAEKNAVKFCSIGAIFKVVPGYKPNSYLTNPDFFAATAPFRKLLKGNNGTLIDFNDNPKTTKEKVLELYDQAIELAKQEEIK